MAFIEDIRDRLVAQGVGVYSTNIFMASSAKIPVGDGPYLLLTETGGSEPARTHGATQVGRPSAQLLARAKTSPAAKGMLQAAWVALGGGKGLHNVTLSGTFYQNILMRQHITDVGLDEAGRVMFSFNIGTEHTTT